MRDSVSAWCMASPAAIGLLLFMVLPFTVAVLLSFTTYRFNSPLPLRWAGFTNYIHLLSSSDFLRAILNNVMFAVVVVPVQTALALMLAMLVNRRLRGMTVFRSLFFMPVIYPMALVAVVWGLIFAPEPAGLMNRMLSLLSFGHWQTPLDFLRSKALAMPCIMLMSVWQGVGFQMVILLAALQGIPEALYEAARIDGAGRGARFRHITLPQLRNSLIFVAMVTSILAFRLFDQIWILTRGGPDNATTTVLFQAFVASRERNQVGLGAAMTVLFFIFVGAVAMAWHFGVRQHREVQ